MANFLTVNSIPLSVLIAGANVAEDLVGKSDRAQDGTMRIQRRAVKKKWNFNLAHQSPADALTWIDLLLGRGHHWNFEDATSGLYSSKALPITGANGTRSTTHAKFGSAALKVTSGNNCTAVGALKGTNAGYGWVFGCWQWNGSTFDHVLEVSLSGSTSQQWVNGTAQAVPSPHKWISVSGAGTVTFAGVDSGASPTANRDMWFDDFFCLDLSIGPAASVPSSWSTNLPLATTGFSELAQLNLGGIGIENGGRAVVAVGTPGQTSVMVAQLGGSQVNAHVVPVLFEEV